MDKRIEKTRMALKAAVLELSARQEFSAVTVADIVREAGVGYPTFFRHYESKEDLLADTSGDLVNELMEIILPPILAGDTAEASSRLCMYVHERRSFCRALLATSAEGSVRRQLLHRAEEHRVAVEQARPTGLPSGLALDYTVGAMLSMMSWWMEQGADISPEQMGQLVDRLVMRPVHGPQGTP